MKNNLVTNSTHSHLGGNLNTIDPGTYSELVWKYLLENFKIKKILDVGSGIGYTSRWFIDQDIDVVSIEGLEDNVKNSVVPTLLHDLTIAAYIGEDIDFVVCIEVVEHIEEKYLDNLLTTLTCGNYLLMTHAVPGQKGYHHVNCQPSQYWITHLKNKGFFLLENESLEIRNLAIIDNARWIAQNAMIFKKI